MSPEICLRCGARSLSVCSAVDDARLGRIAALAVPETIAPGRGFIAEGEPANDFFNVTAGTARLFKLLPDGRRQITGFASVGDFLGLAAAAEYAFSAEAIDAVRCCRFSRPRLILLLAEFPALEDRLLQVAAHELTAAQEQMLLLGRKSARERVASFLLARARQPSSGGVARGVRLPMSRADIADYLGLTLETVSRTLTTLRAARLIAIPRAGEITILDAGRLHSIAGGFAVRA
jgi:CRP/FNR family transcriptional regulator, anaerobic regulatory protein